MRVGPNIGEPGLRIGPDGTIWIHYPTGLYKSRDGGATWTSNRPSPAVIFGGDADLVILRDGSLVYADLSGLTIPVMKSTNPQGTGTWIENLAGSNLPLVDRQWLETGPHPVTGHEVVYLVFNQLTVGLRVMKSNTGGVVFEDVATIPVTMGFNCFRGNVAVSQSDGHVYVADCTSAGPRVWSSATAGLAWTSRNVDPRTTGFSNFLFTNVATDAAGNVYTTWSERENGEMNVYVSGSADEGATWTPKLKLTTPTSAGVMAWPVGGSDGRVGIAWYGADRQGNAGSMPDASLWYVKYAVIEDFFGARTVTATTLSGDVIQQGFICGSGTGCNGGRNLLDFFVVQPDAAGRANIAYTDGCEGCTSPGTSRQAKVTFVRQTSGPLLFA